MLQGTRKSVEAMAARHDPRHESERYQALHHFVAKAEWCDEQILQPVRHWFLPRRDLSAGVARQCCGGQKARGMSSGPEAEAAVGGLGDGLRRPVSGAGVAVEPQLGLAIDAEPQGVARGIGGAGAAHGILD
jgi:hypothetical protein